jgi:hypothetical protein
MRTIKTLILTIINICILSSALSARGNTWQLIRISGDTLRGCTLDSLPDIVLYVTSNGEAISLPIDSIALLSRVQGYFWIGAGVGLLVGATSGAIIGGASYKKPTGAFAIDLGPGLAEAGGAFLGATGGFLVGGIIGASLGHNETYELRTEKTLRMKRWILLQALYN